MKLPLANATVALAAIGAFAQAAETESCAGLETYTAPDLSINAVEALAEPVPHCKVTGFVGREIGFSVWLPAEWNGKFVMGGGGGFVGSIQNQARKAAGVRGSLAPANSPPADRHRRRSVSGSTSCATWCCTTPIGVTRA